MLLNEKCQEGRNCKKTNTYYIQYVCVCKYVLKIIFGFTHYTNHLSATQIIYYNIIMLNRFALDFFIGFP